MKVNLKNTLFTAAVFAGGILALSEGADNDFPMTRRAKGGAQNSVGNKLQYCYSDFLAGDAGVGNFAFSLLPNGFGGLIDPIPVAVVKSSMNHVQVIKVYLESFVLFGMLQGDEFFSIQYVNLIVGLKLINQDDSTDYIEAAPGNVVFQSAFKLHYQDGDDLSEGELTARASANSFAFIADGLTPGKNYDVELDVSIPAFSLGYGENINFATLFVRKAMVTVESVKAENTECFKL